jgi:aspartate aminotransferase
MCTHILETTGVAMLPGSCFGRPSNEMTVRLSFVHFNGTHAIERWTHDGCPSIKEILEKGHLHTYCPETLEGIQKLTEYLAQNKSRT